MSGLNLAQLAAHGFAKLTGTQRTAGALAPIASTATGSVEMPYGLTYPAIRPSLDLDFTNGQTVDPRITFTRASTATRTNSRGLIELVPSGVPRIDFDAVTGGCKGLLIEEQRTNLLTYSEQFDNAAWTKTRATVTANTTTAPDGTLTADKLIEDTTASNSHDVRQYPTVSGAYAVSVFAKADTRSSIFVDMYDATNGTRQAVFNLSSGAVTFCTPTVASAQIQAVGNGWYRCSISVSAAATGGDLKVGIYNGSAIYTGDGTSGLFIWGAQLEAGAFPTSYIPTVASQVTRAADVASMTGANFSSWYRQDEGSFVFGQSIAPVANRTQVALSLSDGTANNTMYLGKKYDSTTVVEFGITSGGAGQAFVLTTPASMSNSLLCGAYKLNDVALSTGAAASTDTSAVIPIGINILNIGLLVPGGAGQAINGHLRSLSYYPKRLTNAELVALSTQ